VDETEAAALVATRNLANLRKAILAAGWRITRARVSIFPNARTATRSSFTPQDGRGTASNNLLNAGPSEEPYDALTINVGSVSGRSRVLSLRGIANDVISPGSIYLAPAGFTVPFGLWAGNLIQNFSIRVSDTPVMRQIQNVYISTVNGVPATRVNPAIVVLAADTLGLDLPVRVSGVIGMSGINGVWTTGHASYDIVVGGVNMRAYILNQKRGRSVLGTYDSGGKAWVLSYTLSAINAVAPGYGTSRKTGSFSTRPRGRRSRRPS
jgi:hypothetical protein